MKVYLANGLFSMADRMFNEHLAKRIREAFPDIDLYVPQEAAEINDKNNHADSVTIFQYDKKHLMESDALIAVIDGEAIDAGVAMEIGMFSMLERPIIALYTDIRQQGVNNDKKIQALKDDPTENPFFYKNLMVIGGIKTYGWVVNDIDGVLYFLSSIHYNLKREKGE